MQTVLRDSRYYFPIKRKIAPVPLRNTGASGVLGLGQRLLSLDGKQDGIYRSSGILEGIRRQWLP